MLAYKKILVLVSIVSLSACADFNQAIEDQNNSIVGIHAPSTHRKLSLARSADLTFKRGHVETIFETHLPAGSYKCIAEGSTGSFYIAPKGTFSYQHQGKEESRVGGVFVTKSSGLAQVWFWPEATSEDYWTPVADGAWIANARPGIMGVLSRPWVERDFIVPRNLTR